MIVYQANSDGTYAGPVTLDKTDKCPITGNYLIPGGCVEVVPPDEKNGYNRVWQNGAWQYVEIPQEPEPSEPTLEELKNAKLQQISAWTAAAIIGGFISDSMGAVYTYDSEKEDQDNIRTMHAASLSPNFESDEIYQGHIPIRAIPAGQTEKTILLHNKTQMQALIDDMARHIGNCKKNGWQLQEKVAAAISVDELAASVWPE